MKLSLLAVIALAACQPAVQPAPDADSAPPPPTPAASSACANLRAHDCPEGFGVDGGKSCEAIYSQGLFDLKTSKVAAAKTVDDLRDAGVRCAP